MPRLLLPGADSGDRGLGARLDRIERRLAVGGQVSERVSSQTAAAAEAPREVERPAPPPEQQAPPQQVPAQEGAARTTAPPAHAQPEEAATRPQPPQSQPPQHDHPTQEIPRPAPDGVGAVDTEALRRMWPDVLRQVQGMRRSTWMIISANAQVHRLADGVLELAFSNQGTARGFGAGQHPDVVAAAVAELLGITVRVQATAESGPDATTSPESRSSSSSPSAADGWGPAPPAEKAPGGPPEQPAAGHRPDGRPSNDRPSDDRPSDDQPSDDRPRDDDWSGLRPHPVTST